ncbi:MAG TPA: hypothetical protein DEP23_01465 [Ruminococcaceae bacterium]|jgi:hypothetical protein|nr:hypothetical protein [Oscillospiraceae bacterium]
MKTCPYHNTFVETLHEENNWSEEGHCTGTNRKTMQKFIPEPCTEEGCAAYWDGHCHYKE